MRQPSQHNLHQLLRFFNLPLDCRCKRTVRLRYLALAKEKHPDQQPASAAALASTEFATLQQKYEQLCELLARYESHNEARYHSAGFEQPHHQYVWNDHWCWEQRQWAHSRNRWGDPASWHRVHGDEWMRGREKQGGVHYTNSQHQHREIPLLPSLLRGAGVAGVALACAFILIARHDRRNSQTALERRHQQHQIQGAFSRQYSVASRTQGEMQRQNQSARQRHGKNKVHPRGVEMLRGISRSGEMGDLHESDCSFGTENSMHDNWNGESETDKRGHESALRGSWEFSHVLEQRESSDASRVCTSEVSEKRPSALNLVEQDEVEKGIDILSSESAAPSRAQVVELQRRRSNNFVREVCPSKKHSGNIYGGDKFYERRYIRRPVRLRRVRSASVGAGSRAGCEQPSPGEDEIVSPFLPQRAEMDCGLMSPDRGWECSISRRSSETEHLPVKLGMDDASVVKVLTVEAPVTEAASAYLNL